MIQGTTKTGFEFELDESVVDNWEFMEILDELDENPGRAVRMAKLLLGKEQLEALKTHIKKTHKVVKTTVMMDELQEIMGAKPVKN